MRIPTSAWIYTTRIYATCLLACGLAAPLAISQATLQAGRESSPGESNIRCVQGFGAINCSPFGIATSAESLGYLDKWLPQISDTGIHWLRGFDTFSDIEPTEGSWDWTNVDSQLRIAAKNHVSTSGLFFYGSPWITSSDGFPDTNLPAWSTYVSTLVSHTRGQVKYWEVWNEAPNGTNNATPAEYANLVNSAYAAAHHADPSTNIALTASSNNVNWLDQTIAAGAANHFDYITVHPYEILGAVDTGWEAEFMSIVPTMRKMLKARDPEKANVPIWFTELGEDLGGANNTGPDGTGVVTEASQAQDLIKAYSMAITEGITRVNWFEGMDGDSGPFGLLDANGNQRTAYTAMDTMIHYLGLNPQPLGWVLLNDKDYGFVFRGTTDTVLVTWAPPASTDNVDFGRPVQLVDPVTGDAHITSSYSLTNAPVIVIGVPEKFALEAQLNHSRPFPWGGDYTRAKSVFLTMGPSNIDRGLHQLYAQSTSVGGVFYGSTARDCSKSSAQSFTVDPNYLSYTTTPVKITAVVRGDAANDSAGFNLKYESTTGLKATGSWTSVPGNAQWYTLTWTIDDPQFVGLWGYNFDFDSDSTEYSKYYIQSVTVEKL